jgi:glutaminase
MLGIKNMPTLLSRGEHFQSETVKMRSILPLRSKGLNASVTLACLLFGMAFLPGCATSSSTAGDQALHNEEVTTARVASADSPDIANLQNSLDSVRKALNINRDGEVYSRAVEGTDADDFAIVVTLVDGRTAVTGASGKLYPIMSVSKPFTYALALEQHGLDVMIAKVGVNATGMPYNSMAALVVRREPHQNPMVNAGAITTHSLIDGGSSSEKIDRVVQLYSELANRPLKINEAWRVKPRALSYALSYQAQHVGLLEGDVEDTLQRYLLSNIVGVTSIDLAQMGATLANGGVQPQTGKRILETETVKAVLSAMVTAGMYEDSGRWWAEVGVPAKSGVSGAILAVVPGWGAISAYSPRLDAAGNSVRAAAAIRKLAQTWRLHSFERLIATDQ